MKSPLPVNLSVLAPCYNAEDCLDALSERISKVCRALGQTWELILVDDGSKDGTWAKINFLRGIYPEIVGLRLSRNHGQQLATTAGLSNVRGERVFIIDSDLQDPPELLPQMMAEMDNGADVVYGRRRSRKGVSVLKKICYKLYYRILSWMANTEIPLDTGDFRLITRRVSDLLNAMPEQQRFLRGMVSWAGFKQVAVLYDRDARFAGQSEYTLHKLVGLAVDGIMSFSVRPLRLAIVLGLVFSLLAMLLLVNILVAWLLHGVRVQGWTSLMAVILLMGSMQLIVLGIIGEYLGRLYIQAKGRPLFILAEKSGGQ